MGKPTLVCFLAGLGAVFANINLELWKAAESGNKISMKRLLDIGANPNWRNPALRGETSLHRAVRKNHLEVVGLLLDAGGDVNMRDNLGKTPFWFASWYGYTDLVTMFIKRGADIHIVTFNGGTPPLNVASAYGNADTVKVLINSNADVNYKNKRGETALNYAAAKNKIDIAQLLLSNGADKSLKDNKGRTPMDIARDRGNHNLAYIIENFTPTTKYTTSYPYTQQTKLSPVAKIIESPSESLTEQQITTIILLITTIICLIVITISAIIYLVFRCRKLKRLNKAQPRVEHVHFVNSVNEPEVHVYEGITK